MTLTPSFARFPFAAAAIVTTVAVFGLTAPAHAAQAEASPAPAAAPTAERTPSAKKYCIEMSYTGSRMTKKICKTQAEWNAEGVTLSTK